MCFLLYWTENTERLSNYQKLKKNVDAKRPESTLQLINKLHRIFSCKLSCHTPEPHHWNIYRCGICRVVNIDVVYEGC